jgi:hypothetical protein
MNAAASKDFFISMSRGSPLCFDYECGGLFVCMDWRSFSSPRATDFCHYTPQPRLIKYLPAMVGWASLQFSAQGLSTLSLTGGIGHARVDLKK